jgi:thiosulfate/3-mercaptopyruvate sulfurtransferase
LLSKIADKDELMTMTKDESKETATDLSIDAELRLPGLVVTTGWLADHLDHPALRLLDVREAAHYGEGHLPGAVHVDLQTLSGIVEGVPGMLLPPAAFAAQIERLGIRSGVTVVAYDDNWGLAAARVLWALTRYGVAQAGLLTGGWDQWQVEGRPLLLQVADPLSSLFVAQTDESSIASWSWLAEHLDKPDVVIVDVRGDKEFAEGHIPNAVHWDWMNAVPVGSWEALRPDADLLADLVKAGITPDKEIVTYCRSGVRAAHTYWALRHLGYPRVRNYDGSWLEWQSLSHLPIEH